MEFDKRKSATLSSFKADKSPKGSIDKPIIPLLNSINSHSNYFTTSSCSGRISILAQPKPESTSLTNKKKARGGSWLLISHDPVKSDSVIPLLFPCTIPDRSDLVFRFEPLIIAVECRDVESAGFLVSLAISCGFRESGITSVSSKRVIVGIRCSIRMEVPLGDSDNLAVSSDYVWFLVELANEKMEANRMRTEGFFNALIQHGFVSEVLEKNDDVNGFGDGDGDNELELELEKANEEDGHIGSRRLSHCNVSNVQMVIVGEPLEKLFLWGHSCCVLDSEKGKKIIVFGGFGGVGRHARRNDTLLLDPSNGMLETLDAFGAPPPRLGHTASLVGDLLFVIGGRSDPMNILGDVWTLNTASKDWRQSECTGRFFPPRHRHAAAAVGSNIYVYGGLNNDTVLSSLHVLDAVNLHWKEVLGGGEQPCARHSHSMVAYGSKLFIFGGYSGEKALGDLYSLDVQKQIWKKEKTSGLSPHARFSHSMFVYNNFLGVIGGCPVRQNTEELALLDLRSHKWKHVTLDYIGKELLVRSTANIVGDELVMIGGGAACYAFGTKFSEPLKICLLSLMSLEEKAMPLASAEKPDTEQLNGIEVENKVKVEGSQGANAETATHNCSSKLEAEPILLATSLWVLQLEKKYAKLGKDLLKKFGWLDLTRKVNCQKDGLHVCFPVSERFYDVFSKVQNQCEDGVEMLNGAVERVLLNEVSCSVALNLLKNSGAALLADENVETRRKSKSPLQTMKEAIVSLIKHKGLSTELLEQLPSRWERLGDIVVLPEASFKDPSWDVIGEGLWPAVARSLNTHRLARKGRVAPTGTRDSTLEMLVGHNGWVEHRENGILYSFDATKCMFSWGNLSEKLRMGQLDCQDEIVVDLFAGIGYFVLPFLVRAKAKLVYACEWNPHAVEALRRNLEANSVSDRCIVLEGDNRVKAPRGVADRVCLGLLPSSESSWVTAIKALRSEGGMLHVHGNVKDSEEELWTEHAVKSMKEIATSEGYDCEASIEHVERVKWYAPHIRHLVADIKCRLIQR